MDHSKEVARARDIAQKVIAPFAGPNDKEARFSSEAVEALGKGGLMGFTVPKDFGGVGLGPGMRRATSSPRSLTSRKVRPTRRSISSTARRRGCASMLEVKAAAGESAIRVTSDAMRACGGAAFSKHASIERFFRDAHAGAVMAPTGEVLREFIGEGLLGIPLF